MVNLREFFEIDPTVKNHEWANKIIRELRMQMEYVVDPDRAKENMQYLLAKQDMSEVKAMFKDPTKAGVSFQQLAVMEKIRNVLIEEMENEDLHCELKATDPTAVNQRKQDRDLLKNRKMIEGVVSSLQQMVGLGPYSLKDEKSVAGKDPFNGNIEEFDNMGLNDSSDEDIDFFMRYFHRLYHEIMGEAPINFFIKYNEVSELIPSFINDLMTKYAIAMRTYVNDESGAIDWKYLAPETVKAVMGRRRDFKDAQALCYEQRVSVSEMIGLIGNAFDFDTDMPALLNAVNFANSREYTGVTTDRGFYFGSEDGDTCTYSEFLKFYVDIGYIEWKSTDAKAYKITESNFHGNKNIYATSVNGQSSPDSTYSRTVSARQCTYKSFYLIFSSTTQKLYKYGKLTYQLSEGSEDEYSNFSIVVYKKEGNCAVEVAKPYIRFLEKNFKKFEWMVVRAKPPGRGYNYESLVQIAENMYPDHNQATGVEEVLRRFYDGIDELYTLPTVNGQPVGGGAQPNYDIPHGLSKAVLEFKAMIDWAFQQINDQLGISPLRNAYTPEERDGYNLQMEALNSSRTATGYMRKIIFKSIYNAAKRTMLFCQDIIQFKDKSTIPYKFLLTALGDQVMEALDALGKVPMHRYGIFVEGFTGKQEKARKMAETMMAFDKGQINYEQKLLLDSIVSPKRAGQVLAYMSKVTERRKMEQEKAASQNRMAEDQNRLQLEIQKEQMVGEIQINKEKVKGEYLVKVALIQQDTELRKQGMKIDADPDKINSKSDANIREDVASHNLANQKPLEV